MFIGNERVFSHFMAATKAGNLAHAYTFSGPSGVGKRTLATLLAAELLRTSVTQVQSNPDFLFLARTVDEKTGTPKTEISVAAAREFRRRLGEKSWGGGYRVAIIDDAERLSTEAGNALLKIVEEPPERTVLFFLTTDVSALITTIRSRTAVYYFPVVPAAAIVAGLISTGVAIARAEQVADLAWGLPGRAFDLVNNPEFASAVSASVTELNKLTGGSIAERLKIIESITEKKEGERVADDVAAHIDEWLMVNRRTGADSSTALADALIAGKSKLAEQVNPRLILESIFLSI